MKFDHFKMLVEMMFQPDGDGGILQRYKDVDVKQLAHRASFHVECNTTIFRTLVRSVILDEMVATFIAFVLPVRTTGFVQIRRIDCFS